MRLGFEESQSSYSSGSQSARAWTETWVSTWVLPALRQREDFLLSEQ
jgi:hypothetical protein